MNMIPMWMRRKTIGQLASERLQDTRLAILEAEATLERAKAELQMLSARESRLAGYVEAWAGDMPGLPEITVGSNITMFNKGEQL